MAKEDNSKKALATTGPSMNAMQNWSVEDLEKEGFSQEVIFSFNEEGEKIKGIYVGPGTPITLSEPDEEGNNVDIPTWLVKNGATTVQVMGKYELNQFFGSLPSGSKVAIIYTGLRPIPGRARQVKTFQKWAVRPDGVTIRPELSGNSAGARQATA